LYQESVLDNGLRVLTANMPHTHSVCVSIFIGAGSRYETDAEAGISHFIEHLLFKGTTKRPTARDVAETIEGVGGLFNGGTNKEATVYWCKVAEDHFPLALDVLADIVLHSKFDPQEIEKERQVIIEEINMGNDSPSQRVNMLIDELLWPNHPLGREIAGSKESVHAITRDQMLDYLCRQYIPADSVVAVAGNIGHDEVVAAVGQALGDWTGQAVCPGFLAYRPALAERLRIETRDIEQAHFCLALPGLSLFDPRRFTLDLLSIILGEGMSSRLFTEIRDKRGLAYSIHSYSEYFIDTGAVIIYAGVEPKNIETAVKAVLEQLVQLKENIPEAELSKVKELSKGRLLLRMEDSRSVAGWIGGQEILTQRILSVDQTIAIIEAVTVEELKRLAGEILDGSQLRLAVVGPEADYGSLEGILKL
jgi:predicted Zn-dependent peptidase